MNLRKVRSIYTLEGNVEKCCIYRDGKIVTTYEAVFDVIRMAHQKIGHARDIKKIRTLSMMICCIMVYQEVL